MDRELPTAISTPASKADEAGYADRLIRRIVEQCPRRLAGSADERHAHDLVRAEMEARGLRTHYHRFRFNRSIYVNMALHFGIGVAATALAPQSFGVAFALHLLAATSYLLDSTRKAYLLRRCQPAIESRNLLGTMPARGATQLRIVLCSHVDAAFTGWVFDPALAASVVGRPLPRALDILRRPLELATYTLFALALLDLIQIFSGALGWWMWLLMGLLTLPSLGTFVFNLQVAIKNEVVPGANDNLSGVAGVLLLAERFRRRALEDVELVFVATGAEEAGTGGAWALAREVGGAWDPAMTVVVNLDGLAGGELRFFDEGEIIRTPVPTWLRGMVARVAAADPRFALVRAWEIPAGASDAAPFVARGYPSVTVGCVDPALGTPQHYHLPSDTPDNLDPRQIVQSVDFVEKLVEQIVSERLGRHGRPPPAPQSEALLETRPE